MTVERTRDVVRPPAASLRASALGERRERTSLYVASARRAWSRYGVHPERLVARADPRSVWIVGSPRSGTSFTAESIGKVTGYADLGELRPLKRAIPLLTTLPHEQVVAHLRRILAIAQRAGMVSGLRPIEQTPESTFLIPAIAEAFPEARFVHLVRDGRDVAASLLGLGWLRDVPTRPLDEVGNAFGDHSRFWVENDRRAEFPTVSEARRAAWVWRRYNSAARDALAQLPPDRTIRVRYEDLLADRSTTARALAESLGATDRADEFVQVFGATRSSARGRWRRDLTPTQLDDVLTEAGALLREFGYVDNGASEPT